MISASMAYNLLSGNMKQSLDRVASQATVKRDAEYFKNNINNVKDVDDFIGNYRLYSYAMTAYGLDDMTYAKAFMKKVLESDLTDPESFANKLTDTRYKEFAAAFNFNTPAADAQSDAQEDDLIGLYTQSLQDSGKAASTESDYFKSAMTGAQNVNDVLGNPRLKNYVLTTFGIDPTYVSNAFLKNVLTSDVNDPTSFVNTQANAKYQEMASYFNFNADGSVTASAQTPDQESSLIEKYTLNSLEKVVDYDDQPGEPDDIYYVTAAAAQYNKAYYEKTIKTVTTVDQLMSDDRMVSYIKAAFSLGKHGYGQGIGDALSDFGLRQALTDASLADQLGLTELHDAFNFQSDGTVGTSGVAQSDANIATTSTQYMVRYNDEANDFIDDITANYKNLINSTTSVGSFSAIKSVNDFLRDNASIDFNKKNDDLPDMYHVALQAFGLTEAELPKSTVRKLLTSDAYDPNGYVASFKDDRITSFARAFNFGIDGKVSSELQALPAAVMAKYATNYKSRATMGLDDGPIKDKAAKDATTAVDDFGKDMAGAKSLDDFLKSDKLTSFVLKANGLDPKKYDEKTLREIFTSDPSDSKSYLNTKADSKFKEIVADFNFDTEGSLTRAKIGAIQNTGATERTQQSYLQQTLETQEGETNDGVRLALYFARKAPDITSLYTILGDKALFQVITTTYSLPSGISSMDVDKQVDLLKKFVNLDDLQDSKKVDKLMKRFTAMYDLQNNSGTSPALTILTNGGTTSTSLL